MSRLVVLVCILGLLAGCSRSSTKSGDGPSKSNGGGYSKGAVKEKGGSDAAQIAESFIADTYKGMYEIIAVKEQPTTFRKGPAVVVHLQWKIKGEDDTKNKLYLVQDGRVKHEDDYDATKSLDENVSAFVKRME